MSPSELHVVTCVFNPIGWGSRIRHYREFREHMLDSGVHLTVVECALGRRPHVLDDGERHVRHVPVRAETIAWNKENLINIGVRHLPETARHVGWFDADVVFRRSDWASATVDALQQYKVVQPWSEAIDLGPRGEPMFVKGSHVQTSFAKVWRELGDIRPYRRHGRHEPPHLDPYAYPHPGYAWAARRGTLNALGGLIEVSGLGAGDHQMAMAMIGKVDMAIHGQTSAGYKAGIRAWAALAGRAVDGSLGYVQGTLEHQFHGDKAKRLYHERWDVLVRHQFDPVTDLRRNLDGVIELAGNKPAMERDFDRYMRQRDEDANILA